MFDKTDFVNSLAHEIKCIKHLATKVAPGALDYRPTLGQRSTLELLGFLSNVVSAGMTAVLEEGFTGGYAKYKERRAEVTLENFAIHMDEQSADITSILEKFTDEEMEKDLDLFGIGHVMKKRAWLVETVLKWVVAYKMQLFLYIKANGVSTIGTMDLWQGMDTPVK